MNGSKPSRLLAARIFESAGTLSQTRFQSTPALSTDQTDMSTPQTTTAAATAAGTAAGTIRHNDAPGATPAGRTPVQPLIHLVGDTVDAPMPPDVETVASTVGCEDESTQDVDMAPDDGDLFPDPDPQGRAGVESDVATAGGSIDVGNWAGVDVDEPTDTTHTQCMFGTV